MTTVLKYLNEVEAVGFTQSAAGAVVDLAPFLKNTTAKGVILRLAAQGRELFIGAWSIGESQRSTKVFSTLHVHTMVNLLGGTTINVLVNDNIGNTSKSARLYITGELHDDVVLHTGTEVEIRTTSAEQNTWIDRTVTLIGGDSIGDVQAVIVTTQSADDNDFGVREKGSTDLPMGSPAESGAHWFIVGVNGDGVYQTYSSFNSSMRRWSFSSRATS